MQFNNHGAYPLTLNNIGKLDTPLYGHEVAGWPGPYQRIASAANTLQLVYDPETVISTKFYAYVYAVIWNITTQDNNEHRFFMYLINAASAAPPAYTSGIPLVTTLNGVTKSIVNAPFIVPLKNANTGTYFDPGPPVTIHFKRYVLYEQSNGGANANIEVNFSIYGSNPVGYQ